MNPVNKFIRYHIEKASAGASTTRRFRCVQRLKLFGILTSRERERYSDRDGDKDRKRDRNRDR